MARLAHFQTPASTPTNSDILGSYEMSCDVMFRRAAPLSASPGEAPPVCILHVVCMDASRNARIDFCVTVRQIAVLYPAYRCGALCPLAPMEFADPRLISSGELFALHDMQAWRIAV